MPVKAVGWIAKATFGGTARRFAVGFSIASKGYIGTGSDATGDRNDFWEYDPASNVWTQKTNFGGAARKLAVGFSIGTKGYIGTGNNFNGELKDFWEFDPTTNAWTQKADFGGAARSRAVGFNILDKGYLGTGYNSSTSTLYADFWEYTPSTNTWVQKSVFGGGVRREAVGFSIGNKGYIGIGFDGTSYKADFWQFDQAANTWSQKANIGFAQSLTTGFSIGSKGYIGIGGNSNELWEYDTITDTWIKTANFGGTGRIAATGFAIGMKGFAGTGWDISGLKRDFWEFEPIYIKTGSIQINKYCVDSPVAIPINVTYTISTKFNAGNIFTAQLSDSSGSFASPLNIGSKTDSLGDTITAIIPANQIYGTKYRIRVVSSNPSNIGQDNTIDLSITPVPSASLTIDDTLQCFAENIFNFTNTSTVSFGTIAQSLWSFGDGVNSTKTNPAHSYLTDDTFHIILVSTTKAGCKDTVTGQIIVIPSPLANLTTDDTIQCFPGNIFNFTNTSTVSSGTISQSLWSFGYGITDTTIKPAHSYLIDDTFHIVLVNTTQKGCKDTATAQVIVNPSPKAAFSVSDTIQCFKDNYFTLVNKSSINKGTITFDWDFGNSVTSKVFETSINYLTHGNYNISLVARSGQGCNDTTIIKVAVKPEPVASFTVNDSIQCLSGNNFSFLNTSSIAADTFSSIWDFGDTNYSTNFSDNHIYKGIGNYPVTLFVNSIYGCKDSITKNVAINSEAFIVSSVPAEHCGPGALILSAIAKNGNIGWYDSDTGGVLLDTGTVFITDTLYKSKTYYAEASNSGCTFIPRTKVEATIIDSPSVNLTTIPDSNKGPGILVLFAQALQGDIQWYDSALGGTLLGTDNYFTTPLLTVTTTYYAEAVDRGCYSGLRTAVTATILPNSINDKNESIELFIYPNPSNDFINITIRGISEKTSLSLVDLQGRIKICKEIFPTANQYMGILDVTNQAEGMYFIILENRQFYKIVRFGKI